MRKLFDFDTTQQFQAAIVQTVFLDLINDLLEFILVLGDFLHANLALARSCFHAFNELNMQILLCLQHFFLHFCNFENLRLQTFGRL